MKTSFSIFFEIDLEHPIDVMNWYAIMLTGGNADFETLMQDAATDKKNYLGYDVMLEAVQLLKAVMEEKLLQGMSINAGSGLFYLNLRDSGKVLEIVFFPENELLKEILTNIMKSQI